MHGLVAVTMHMVSGGKDLNTSGPEWKRKSLVTFALTILTSSQGILIAWSKRAGGYDYSVTSANFMVEVLKCLISVGALLQIWRREGVTEDNRPDWPHPPSIVMWSVKDAAAIFGTPEDRLRTWALEMVSEQRSIRSKQVELFVQAVDARLQKSLEQLLEDASGELGLTSDWKLVPNAVNLIVKWQMRVDKLIVADSSETSDEEVKDKSATLNHNLEEPVLDDLVKGI
ncbi:hypothetical protein L7F22_054293 [Adiantum nelumboides]|nr:hypothetical protein [Adiantum nelumboides]